MQYKDTNHKEVKYHPIKDKNTNGTKRSEDKTLPMPSREDNPC
jgi:hypothetical protein